MPQPDAVDVLRRVGGWATAAALIAVCGRAAVDRAVAEGSVVRLARGRYALPALPDPWTSAVRMAGVVSHSSAARHWGMAVLSSPEPVHVTIARTRSRIVSAQVKVHWSDLGPGDRDSALPVTNPLRTVLDCARTLPLVEALAIADSSLASGLVGPEELRRAADALNGPGRGRARYISQVADPRAASALESALRAILLSNGMKGFVPQLVIRDADFYARVDLADPDHMLVAEADSFEHHGYRQALVRDCERYDELVVRGWRVLRFAWEHVMFRPEWVATVARAALKDGRRPANMRKTA